MEAKRYKPLIDKLFWIICIPVIAIAAIMTVVSAFFPASLIVMIPTDLLICYFLLSSVFGYVELRKNTLFIKYGLILKKEIPYDKITRIEKDKKLYSESMMSLKNSLEHVNIRYNTFDVTTVSVVDNDGFVDELNLRISDSK